MTRGWTPSVVPHPWRNISLDLVLRSRTDLKFDCNWNFGPVSEFYYRQGSSAFIPQDRLLSRFEKFLTGSSAFSLKIVRFRPGSSALTQRSSASTLKDRPLWQKIVCFCSDRLLWPMDRLLSTWIVCFDPFQDRLLSTLLNVILFN